MTTQTPTVDPTVTIEAPKATKFARIKPVLKTALIWTGAAVGVLAAAVLLSAARSSQFRLETDNTLIVHENPDRDSELTESETTD